ncbi:hypothetical protein VTI74DRAFT_8068 [Chaetomium olivicolor]
MSPCETLTLGNKPTPTDTLPVSLEDYAVTSNGFLPEDTPLERLTNPYYAPWESLVDCLPELIANRTLRTQVDNLPILSTDHLTTESEWRRACVVLGFLTHAYVWGGETAAEILPPSITLPLLSVSAHHGIPPVATYASVNLWNFRTQHTTDFTDLDSLASLQTFTGTPDESWFYVVSVAMEAQGAYIIPLMVSALEATTAKPANYSLIAGALSELTACIGKLGVLLDRMDEQCNPSTFYHRIRPFLAGSKNMASAGLPRGVFYDEGNGKGEWRQLRGGSNGQSSLIQFFDVVLGVEHIAGGNSRPEQHASRPKTGEGREMSFHAEVRAYMPEPHRRFLEDVEARYPGGMKKGVGELLAAGEGEDGALSAEQVKLQEAFQTATKALAEFRNKHLQMVARYIIIPSRQPNPNQGVNLATASSRLKAREQVEGRSGELTGTGGTALLPFLKQSRDETFLAGKLEARC